MNFDGLRNKTKPEQTPAPQTIKEPTLLTWSGNNFERDINSQRVIIFAIALIAFVGYSVWQRDWFILVILVLVGAVAGWYLNTSKPTKTTYSVTSMGIYVGDKFYSFTEIHSFWLVYNETIQELFIAFDRKYLPALSIGIKEVDPVLLRGILLKKIPEQSRRRESLADKAVRYLGL